MIKTVMQDMPPSVKGLTVKTCDADGDNYTIVLNAALSVELQRAAYVHEIQHITNDDFYADASAQLIEWTAHNGN